MNLTSIEMQSSTPFQAGQPCSPVAYRHASDELILAEISRTLRKRRWLILRCVVACVGISLLYVVLRSREYEGTTEIEISPTGTNSLGLSELAAKTLAPSDPTIQLQSAVQILHSNTIAIEAMEQLRMAARADFAGRWIQPPQRTFEEMSPEVRDQLLSRFGKNLKVEILPRTDIVQVRFRAKDPALSADVVNAVVNSYTERNFRTSYNSAMQVSDWLSKQMDDLRTKAEESQHKLADLQKTTGLIGEDESDNIVTDKLKQLDEELTAAESDRIMKEARYRIAGSANPELIATTVPDPTLQVLRSQQAGLRVQFAQLSTKFGSGYPKLAELSNQMLQVEDAIAAELKNLAERYQNEYRAAANTEQMLRVRFDEQKQKAYALNATAAEYAILKHEVESTQDLYETLQLKLKQAGIAAGLASANVGVVDRGAIPSKPVEPRPWLDLMAGFGCGIALGVLCAISLEALDNTVQTGEESEAVTALPTLATIPLVEFERRPRLLRTEAFPRACAPDRNAATVEQPHWVVAESFRSLRSSLLLGNSKTTPRLMVITSAGSSEGKTYTALNCAIVLAQQGARVLLVDADLRHPSLHQAFGISQEPGLTDMLLETCDDRALRVPIDAIPNLTLAPSGVAPSHCAELLASKGMRQMLSQWRDRYDHILIDTPPVCLFTDAVVLGSQADAVLLVARSSFTTKHALRRARDLLLRADANIAGVVLNGVDSQYQNSYYFTRYGYLGGRRSADDDGSSIH